MTLIKPYKAYILPSISPFIHDVRELYALRTPLLIGSPRSRDRHIVFFCVFFEITPWQPKVMAAKSGPTPWQPKVMAAKSGPTPCQPKVMAAKSGPTPWQPKVMAVKSGPAPWQPKVIPQTIFGSQKWSPQTN